MDIWDVLEEKNSPSWSQVIITVIRGVIWIYAGLAFAKYFHGF